MSPTDIRLISRRELMHAGSAVTVGLLAPTVCSAFERTLPLIRRAIPSTGEKLPVIGIGTSRFKPENYTQMIDVLRRMSELGASVIDTAPLFAGVEEMLGNALKETNLREKFFVETKFNAPGTLPATGRPESATLTESVFGLDSFERSLRLLQTNRVDLLMAHFISSVEALMPIMIEQKFAGRTRYIGITTASASQHAQLMEYMRQYPIDFIQVNYSLDDRAAAIDVLPLAIERKIAVMGAVPFGGRSNQLLQKTSDKDLPKWAADFDAHSWSQVLLKYAASHPAMTCLAPGMTKVEHLEDNLAAGRGRLPNASQRKRLEMYWDDLMGKT